jgi:O-antigen ligase
MSEVAAAVRLRAGREDSIALAQAVGAAVLAGGVGAANGGFFPTSWGWTALILAWVGIAALVVQQGIVLTRLELGFLGALIALTAWVWLSALWSAGTERTFLDGERMLVYFTGVGVVLIIRRLSYVAVLAGLATGMTVTAAYGLATRLFPDHFGLENDPVAGYRLIRPVGYYNALGLYCAMAAIVMFALAARAKSRWARPLAAAALVVLLPTLYFTFSRGAWFALGFAVVVAVAFDPGRLQLVATSVVAVPAVVAVLLGRHAVALTEQRPTLSAATSAGHRLAVEVVLLALVAVALSFGQMTAERRVEIAPRVRRAYAGGLVLAVLAAVIAIFVHFGSPTAIASRAYHAFTAPPPTLNGNLNQRLTSFSGSRRVAMWHAAWTDATAHPVLGSGAGTFDTWWFAHRHTDYRVTEAHSLYLETLAELGPVGLGLLAVLLGLPLAAGIRARRQPYVFAALAAYAAYLLHAIGDWDWEVPAVTLTALILGALCVRAASAAGEEAPSGAVGRTGRLAAAGVLAAVAAFAFVTLVGNGALAKSRKALDAGDFVQAQREAAKAHDWMPWSALAWERLGETEVVTLQRTAARASFRHALAQEPHDWLLWYELEGVTRGAERRHAADEVIRLNPRSQQAAQLRRLIARGRL